MFRIGKIFTLEADASSLAVNTADNLVGDIDAVISKLRSVSENHLAEAKHQRDYAASALALADSFESEANKAEDMIKKLIDCGFGKNPEPAPVVSAPVVNPTPEVVSSQVVPPHVLAAADAAYQAVLSSNANSTAAPTLAAINGNTTVPANLNAPMTPAAPAVSPVV